MGLTTLSLVYIQKQETGKQKRKKKKENAKNRRGGNGAQAQGHAGPCQSIQLGGEQQHHHHLRHHPGAAAGFARQQDDSGFSRDASDSPNDAADQPSSGDESQHQFRHHVVLASSSFPPRTGTGAAPICKFFLPRRAVNSPPKVQEEEDPEEPSQEQAQQQQPDGFLDLNSALLSFIDAPDAVENDLGLNQFSPGVLAAGTST
jgi:hypothetical protein